MFLMYIDESGSTGLDLDNKEQPYFVLTGVCVDAKDWHKINDYFEQEKIKICKELKNVEIHTNELYNSNPKSAFYKNIWKDNLAILEKIGELISTLDIKIFNAVIYKKTYKKHFGNNIIVDPYLFSFAVIYEYFNNFLNKSKDYGIVFCDELKKMENSLEVMYPKLKKENKNIIEKTFYLNSKKNNYIQIADVCSFYINKYNCIQKGIHTMDTYKTNHCIKMYKTLSVKFGKITGYPQISDFENYF